MSFVEDDEDYNDELDEDDDDDDYYEDDEEDYLDRLQFAEPGGESALRAATSENPRNLSCPTCGEPDRLTPLDVQAGYQCNQCAAAAERGY